MAVIMGCNVCVSSRRDTASQYGKGRNISVSRLRYSANHNALDSWIERMRKNTSGTKSAGKMQ